jgi:hypothetical protein
MIASEKNLALSNKKADHVKNQTALKKADHPKNRSRGSFLSRRFVGWCDATFSSTRRCGMARIPALVTVMLFFDREP